MSYTFTNKDKSQRMELLESRSLLRQVLEVKPEESELVWRHVITILGIVQKKLGSLNTKDLFDNVVDEGYAGEIRSMQDNARNLLSELEKL